MESTGTDDAVIRQIDTKLKGLGLFESLRDVIRKYARDSGGAAFGKASGSSSSSSPLSSLSEAEIMASVLRFLNDQTTRNACFPITNHSESATETSDALRRELVVYVDGGKAFVDNLTGQDQRISAIASDFKFPNSTPPTTGAVGEGDGRSTLELCMQLGGRRVRTVRVPATVEPDFGGECYRFPLQDDVSESLESIDSLLDLRQPLSIRMVKRDGSGGSPTLVACQEFEWRKVSGSLLDLQKNPTSTNTLAQLNMMSASELKKAVKKLRPKNKRAKFALQCAHRKLFRQWLMQLHAGFNVLLFGVGSKKKTLQRFASEWLTEGPVLVVNGYFPALNLQKILYAITKDIMPPPPPTFATLLEHVEYIREFIPEWGRNVYMVIHNIDGESLRSEAAQSAWWKEFTEIRPSHRHRLVRLFAQRGDGTKAFACTFVTPIEAPRLLDTPLHAARFVSLMPELNADAQSIGAGNYRRSGCGAAPSRL
eukprot:jgi/Bigna1/74551/fgenesh1_pg.29_\